MLLLVVDPTFDLAGGRDTAGLGGIGGPYRLDAGHTVHQVSDAEKAAVPEEVKRAAREMGQKAFKQRYCHGNTHLYNLNQTWPIC